MSSSRCPFFDVIHPAFPLPTTASATLRGALKDVPGEVVEARHSERRKKARHIERRKKARHSERRKKARHSERRKNARQTGKDVDRQH